MCQPRATLVKAQPSQAQAAVEGLQLSRSCPLGATERNPNMIWGRILSISLIWVKKSSNSKKYETKNDETDHDIIFRLIILGIGCIF